MNYSLKHETIEESENKSLLTSNSHPHPPPMIDVEFPSNHTNIRFTVVTDT